MTKGEREHVTIFNNRTLEETFAEKDTSKTITDGHSIVKQTR